MSNSEQLAAALRQALGPGAVTERLGDRLAAHGVYPPEFLELRGGLPSCLPAAIVRPASVAEVAATVRLAARYGVPILPYGGGSGIVGGTWGVDGAVLVDLKRLRTLEVDPASMTACAGAGLSGAHLEEALNRRGLTSGHYPQSMFSATVGGMVATAAAGTFSTGYGKMDDLVIALEAVLPDGSIVRTPVQPKHSAGPNLNALLVGSEGSFGIVTRAWLKVFRVPERRTVEGFAFPDTESGLEAVRQCVHGSVGPALVRLYDEHEAVPRLRALGRDGGPALLLLGFDGPARLVEVKLDLARDICRAAGGESLGAEPGERWLRDRFSTAGLLRSLQAPGGVADALEVSAQWRDLPRLWRALRAAAEPLCTEVHAHFSHFYQTGGNIYLIFHATASREEMSATLYHQILDAVLGASLAHGGNTSHHHGVGRAKVRWLQEELGETYALLATLKRAIDPAATLNPGVLGLGGSELVAP